MELKNTISGNKNFSEEEKQIGQIIRYAYLSGYNIELRSDFYSGKPFLQLSHPRIKMKNSFGKYVPAAFQIPTNSGKFNYTSSAKVYSVIAQSMGKSVESYYEDGVTFSKIGDKIMEDYLDYLVGNFKKFYKTKDGEAPGQTILNISRDRQFSDLFNPVAMVGELRPELMSIVDDQINEDLGALCEYAEKDALEKLK